MKFSVIFAGISGSVLVGCVAYTPPETSGLISVRAFPTAADVCQVIGENDLTQQYLDDSATLIGCPSHERGAIDDRLASGAIELDQVGSWVLLSVPN